MTHIDLNLVRTFCVLYEQGGVTQTAEELHLSQPTVSYALKNLRRHFRDELFIRSGRLMEPTDLAHRLYSGFKEGLSQILATGEHHLSFDPQETQRSFTLWLSDLGELAFLPQIMQALRRQAPNSALIVEPLNVSRVGEVLMRGEIDAAILTPHLEISGIERTVVFHDQYIVIASADHPRVQGSLTPEQYAQERHVQMASDIGHGAPEASAHQWGTLGECALRLSRFAAIPALVQGTDLLAVLPRSAVDSSASLPRVQILPFPLSISPLEVALYDRPESRQGEAQRWFSHCLKTVLHSIPQLRPDA